MKMMTDRALKMGKGKNSEIFPEGVHTKYMKSAEDSGHMADYPDTEEKILRDQEGGVRKAMSNRMKEGYRQ